MLLLLDICLTFLFLLSTTPPRTALAVFLLAPSLNWMDVPSVNSTTITAEEPFATGVGSPSLVAASVPWATSSILSTLYVLSAWRSCRRESSESRMTRPTVNPASISSSHCNLSYIYTLFWFAIKFKPREERVHLYLLTFCSIGLQRKQRWWTNKGTSRCYTTRLMVLSFDLKSYFLFYQVLEFRSGTCCLVPLQMYFPHAHIHSTLVYSHFSIFTPMMTLLRYSLFWPS